MGIGGGDGMVYRRFKRFFKEIFTILTVFCIYVNHNGQICPTGMMVKFFADQDSHIRVKKMTFSEGGGGGGSYSRIQYSVPSLYIRDGFNTLISFYGKSNSEKRPIAEAGRGGLWSCWPASAIEDIYLVVPYQPQNVRLGCTRPKCSVQKVSKNRSPKSVKLHMGHLIGPNIASTYDFCRTKNRKFAPPSIIIDAVSWQGNNGKY